jgi:hypothetical protein
MRFQMYKGFKRDLVILIGLIILLLIFKTIGG